MNHETHPRLSSLLAERKLPALLTMADGAPVTSLREWRIRRSELLHLLSDQVYGFTPDAPEQVRSIVTSSDPAAFAGKATQQTRILSFNTPAGEFAFPISVIIPNTSGQHPLFVCIAFRPDIPDRYLPAEELIDCGYAVASFCYQDITSDDSRRTGLALHYPIDPQNGWGKIGMWAFAASRVLDHMLMQNDIARRHIAVCGHSRLGKTALWCAAQDERFSLAISNDSGCSGAALSRGKQGETIADITDRFPYWFCENYKKWRGREDEMPFDQHMLLSLIAPRNICIGSAEQDAWADPLSEFLSCCAVSEVYALHDLAGLHTPDRIPQADCALQSGTVGYHLRCGTHFLSRTDWLRYIHYRDLHHV